MSGIKRPSTLHKLGTRREGDQVRDTAAATLAGALIMAVSSSVAMAQAQGSSQPGSGSAVLPPVNVETQKQAPRPKAKQATAPQKQAPAAAAPAPAVSPPTGPAASTAAPNANPYANPDAPYNVQQSASGKLTEPLADTPRTVTALPKEVIEDKGARDLRELARGVPGLTIGSAEGGNAYGAFAVRGFKANNDIFVDGIRNPGNLTPDVFSVEQIEIYKGPSSGIAGRSTIGGAVNIITKQPTTTSSFFETRHYSRHRQHHPHDGRYEPGYHP